MVISLKLNFYQKIRMENFFLKFRNLSLKTPNHGKKHKKEEDGWRTMGFSVASRRPADNCMDDRIG